MDWLYRLKQLVERKPIVVLRFYGDEWERLLSSSKGPNEFTVARSHEILKNAKPSTPCLILGKSDESENLYFGHISSKSAVTTLESRIKITRGMQIRPKTKPKLLRLVCEAPHAKNLRNRMSMGASVIVLSPKLSSYLIDRLASLQENKGALRTVVESLTDHRGSATMKHCRRMRFKSH